MKRTISCIVALLYAYRMFIPIAVLIPAPALIIIIALLFILYPLIGQYQNKDYIALCAVLFFTEVIMRISQEVSLATSIYRYLILLPSGLLSLYVYKSKDNALLKCLFFAILIGIGITGCTTYLGCLKFPGISREMATGSVELYNDELFRLGNIGGFDTIYIFNLLLPFWITIIKDKMMSKVSRFLAAIVVVTSVMGIVQSEYTTALIFMLLSLILFFVPNNMSIKSFLGVAILALIFVLIMKESLPLVFGYIADNVESTDVKFRMYELSGLVIGEEMSGTDFGSRQDRFIAGIDAFTSSPLWGTFEVHGGHSFIAMTLGFWGLIGACFIYVMLKKMYTLFIKPFLNHGFNTCLFFICFMYISFLVLNPQIYLIAVLFLIPLIGNYIIHRHNMAQPNDKIGE